MLLLLQIRLLLLDPNLVQTNDTELYLCYLVTVWPPGLLGYWPFNPSHVVDDVSGQGHHAVVYGDVTAGTEENSLHFPG